LWLVGDCFPRATIDDDRVHGVFLRLAERRSIYRNEHISIRSRTNPGISGNLIEVLPRYSVLVAQG
jgi:hypothetical protein